MILVSGEKILDLLKDIESKMDHALKMAKNIEDIKEEIVNEVVETINRIVKKADAVADYIIGMIESEEL